MEDFVNAQGEVCEPQRSRLVAVKQVPNTSGYEWVSEGTLRHWIFNAKDQVGSSGSVVCGNGFGSAMLRFGRKILIDLDALDVWVEAHRM